MGDNEDRLDDLIQMALAGATLREMGQKWGITRERIRQILRRAGVVTTDIRALTRLRLEQIPIPCSLCGKDYLPRHARDHFKAGTHRYLRRKDLRTPEEIERDRGIVADYKAGMLTREIMAKYHVSPARIRRAFGWAHEPMPHRKRGGQVLKTRLDSQVRMMAIARDYQAGQSSIELADKYHVSPTTVTNSLRFAGVPSRDQGMTPEKQRKMAEGRHRAALTRRRARENR